LSTIESQSSRVFMATWTTRITQWNDRFRNGSYSHKNSCSW